VNRWLHTPGNRRTPELRFRVLFASEAEKRKGDYMAKGSCTRRLTVRNVTKLRIL
jgi:hypothetical protein